MVFRLKSTSVICLPIILLHLGNEGCLIFSRSTGQVCPAYGLRRAKVAMKILGSPH